MEGRRGDARVPEWAPCPSWPSWGPLQSPSVWGEGSRVTLALLGENGLNLSFLLFSKPPLSLSVFFSCLPSCIFSSLQFYFAPLLISLALSHIRISLFLPVFTLSPFSSRFFPFPCWVPICCSLSIATGPGFPGCCPLSPTPAMTRQCLPSFHPTHCPCTSGYRGGEEAGGPVPPPWGCLAKQSLREQAGAWSASRWCRRNEAERDGKRGHPMKIDARNGKLRWLPEIQDC